MTGPGIYYQLTSRHMVITTTIDGQTRREGFVEVTRNQPWSFAAEAGGTVSVATVAGIVRLNGDGTTTEDPSGITATVNSIAQSTITFTIDAAGAFRNDWFEVIVAIEGSNGTKWSELLGVKVVG